MNVDLHVFGDQATLNRRVAAAVAETISDAARRTGRCTLALSGGRTPQAVYEILAREFHDRAPWASTQIFWGDERFVPEHDPRSNAGMARRALLDHVPCPPSHVHSVDTRLPDAEAAARHYEARLRDFFADGTPAFDLLLLGIGEDGHTASVFPDSPALGPTSHWVEAVLAPVDPPQRVTLTIPALLAAVRTFVLVAGPAKAHALRHVLADKADRADTRRWPASALRASSGHVTWWVDRPAAAELSSDLQREIA